MGRGGDCGRPVSGSLGGKGKGIRKARELCASEGMSRMHCMCVDCVGACGCARGCGCVEWCVQAYVCVSLCVARPCGGASKQVGDTQRLDMRSLPLALALVISDSEQRGCRIAHSYVHSEKLVCIQDCIITYPYLQRLPAARLQCAALSRSADWYDVEDDGGSMRAGKQEGGRKVS